MKVVDSQGREKTVQVTATDHGTLSGLADDDHTQYAKNITSHSTSGRIVTTGASSRDIAQGTPALSGGALSGVTTLAMGGALTGVTDATITGTITHQTYANPPEQMLVKTADESRNNLGSGTSYTDDDTIAGITIPAGETWLLLITMFWEANATPDLKARINNSGTALSAGRWGMCDDRTNYVSTDFSGSEAGTAFTASTGVEKVASFWVYAVAAGGGAATLALEWAQNTSSSSDSTVLAGTNMRAWRKE